MHILYAFELKILKKFQKLTKSLIGLKKEKKTF